MQERKQTRPSIQSAKEKLDNSVKGYNDGKVGLEGVNGIVDDIVVRLGREVAKETIRKWADGKSGKFVDALKSRATEKLRDKKAGREDKGWMDRDGKFYLVSGRTHEDWARQRLGLKDAWGNMGSNKLYEKGWLRIIPYGSDELSAQTIGGRGISHIQMKELSDMAIENGFEKVRLDNESVFRVVWSDENEQRFASMRVADRLHGYWVDVSGKKYSVKSSEIHEMAARRILGLAPWQKGEGQKEASDVLLEKGWVKITSYGANMCGEIDGNRVFNSRQKKEILDTALEDGTDYVYVENLTGMHLVWSREESNLVASELNGIRKLLMGNDMKEMTAGLAFDITTVDVWGKVFDMNRFERIASKVANGVLAFDASAEDYQVLMDDGIGSGRPILTAQEIHRDIPTIHNFAGKYRDTLDHVGCGMFEGKTEHGKFEFEGGGAMHRAGQISWTTLRASSPVVFRDLGYDIQKVKRALEELIAKSSVNV